MMQNANAQVNAKVADGGELLNHTSCQNPNSTYNNPTYATTCEKCGADVVQVTTVRELP